MHSSRLDTESVEATILAYLREHGEASTLEINEACGTVCGSTFLSSVRARLRGSGWTIPPARRVETDSGPRWYYRIEQA